LAIFQRQYQNVAQQTAQGIDLTARYRFQSNLGKFDLIGSSTWLRIRQRDTELSQEREVSGTIFNPPKNKFRLGSSWERDWLSAAIFVNYVSSETDNSAGFVAGSTSTDGHVASWTTVDTQLAYRLPFRQTFLDDLTLTLSAQNLLNRKPPTVSSQSTTYGGLNYDAANASALARFVTINFAIRLNWGH
jgi:iron complex outermembrane receptor protein